MKTILFGICLSIFFTLTGCSSNETPTVTQPQPISPQFSSSADQYREVRNYEQAHGLFDWRNAPAVT